MPGRTQEPLDGESSEQVWWGKVGWDGHGRWGVAQALVGHAPNQAGASGVSQQLHADL